MHPACAQGDPCESGCDDPRVSDLTAARRRLYLRALTHLASAEALAHLEVVGASDAPPTQEADASSWAEDWAKRAKDTLRRAYEWAQSGAKDAQERAGALAREVQAGARAVADASRGWSLTDGVKDLLQKVYRAASIIATATIGAVASNWIIGAIALYLYLNKR